MSGTRREGGREGGRREDRPFGLRFTCVSMSVPVQEHLHVSRRSAVNVSQLKGEPLPILCHSRC